MVIKDTIENDVLNIYKVAFISKTFYQNIKQILYDRKSLLCKKKKVMLKKRPLKLAVKFGYKDIINFFIKNGKYDKRLIGYAARGGDGEVINLAIKFCVPKLISWDETYYEMLKSASYKGHLNSIKYVMVLNQSKSYRDYYLFENCITQASYGGHLNIIKFFTELNSPSKHYSRTPIPYKYFENIEIAAYRGYQDIVTYFLELTKYSNKIMLYQAMKGAISGNKLKLIKYLYELHKTIPEYMDLNDNIANSYMLMSNHSVRSLKFFIEKGANNLNECLIENVADLRINNIKLLIKSGANNFDECIQRCRSYSCSYRSPWYNRLSELFLDLRKGGNLKELFPVFRDDFDNINKHIQPRKIPKQSQQSNRVNSKIGIFVIGVVVVMQLIMVTKNYFY